MNDTVQQILKLAGSGVSFVDCIGVNGPRNSWEIVGYKFFVHGHREPNHTVKIKRGLTDAADLEKLISMASACNYVRPAVEEHRSLGNRGNGLN